MLLAIEKYRRRVVPKVTRGKTCRRFETLHQKIIVRQGRAMLRLFYSTAACSMAPHIALEEAGMPFEATSINILKRENFEPTFRAINPKGFIPVLQTARGIITENPAILLYIGMAAPAAGLLTGYDAEGLAETTSFNSFLSSAVHVTYRHISRPRLFAEGETAHAALLAKVPEMLGKYFNLIEERLSDGRPWVHGDQYTVSDPYLFVYASYLFWRGDRGDPYAFPNVLKHRERVLIRPATRRALDREGIDDPANFGRERKIMALDSESFVQSVER
jgi:glutathione S-transferase